MKNRRNADGLADWHVGADSLVADGIEAAFVEKSVMAYLQQRHVDVEAAQASL